ncbi:MAG: hypothetical protein KKC51_15690, partial [Verrucomicrobia bacterium]|nr:hypothetical protein [Verrucomicrobiota bacterium]
MQQHDRFSVMRHMRQTELCDATPDNDSNTPRRPDIMYRVFPATPPIFKPPPTSSSVEWVRQ